MQASRESDEGVVLTDEGEVVVAARGVRDRGATVDRDPEGGGVQAVAAVDLGIHRHIAGGVADADSITDVATAVDIADGDSAAVGRGRGNAAVARRGGIDELGGSFRHSGETHHSSGHCRTDAMIHGSRLPSVPCGCALFPKRRSLRRAWLEPKFDAHPAWERRYTSGMGLSIADDGWRSCRLAGRSNPRKISHG